MFGKIKSDSELNPNGIGLGLFACKQLVEQMKGSIGFSSVYGEGSIFWFEIPMKICGKIESLDFPDENIP